MKLTAVFEKTEDGYIAYIEELPGANTQGRTIDEARQNLIEAVSLTLEANKHLAELELVGKNVTKEIIEISSYEAA